jgi:hypothetical protein
MKIAVIHSDEKVRNYVITPSSFAASLLAHLTVPSPDAVMSTSKKDKPSSAIGSIRKRPTKGDKPTGSPIGTSSAMPETQSRRLHCLIAGQSIVFLVIMGCDYVVSELKGVIQKERGLDMKDVHTLELWKVSAIDELRCEVT